MRDARGLAGLAVWVLLAAGSSAAAERAADSPPPAALLIRVPLPLAGEADNRVRRMVQESLGRWSEAAARPVLILQFGGGEPTGKGSQFERAFALARFLTSPELNRVRTVAYLAGVVEGHAVLPVLACEEIVAHPEATLGRAGLDEAAISETMRRAYTEIAEYRRTLPVPLALGMLDPRLGVYQVQTLEGTQYVAAADLERLKSQTTVRAVEQVIPEGEWGNFSGATLRLKLGQASHLARDRRELTAAVGLPPGAIEEDPALGQSRRAVLVELSGPMRAETVSWIERSIREQLAAERVNFVCLTIDSPGGSAADSARLATFLAGLDPSAVRTVAYVQSAARNDASLVALACDELVMADDAVLGGPGLRRITRQRLDDLQSPIREIAAAKGRDWSLLQALLDPQLTVRRYQHPRTGQQRYFCPEELAEQPDAADWQAGAEVDAADGVPGSTAVEWRLAKVVANQFGDFQQLYHLEEELTMVRPTWAHRTIELLASPQVAGVLLFIAWFALMVEFMTPGIGLPGFIAAVCFMLYFWSHFLHGTAGWLEVLLFLAGVGCVGLEIFVLPGIGAFGVGGVALIVAAIALASQTFLVPRNAYEWTQVQTSLMLVLAGFAGAVVSLICMRRAVTGAPVFKRVALETPDSERRQEIQYHESLVHFDHLVGQQGLTATQLTPGGKARFGEQLVDVLSDGDIIPRGTAVYVAEVRGNEVLVRRLENG